MGCLLFIYDEKEEDWASDLLGFFKALGAGSVLMFSLEKASGLSADEAEARYLAKADCAAVLVSAGDKHPFLSSLLSGQGRESKLLIKHFGKNSGRVFYLVEKGGQLPEGETHGAFFERQDLKQAIRALAALAGWVNGSVLKASKPEPAHEDPSVDFAYRKLEPALRTYVWEIGRQERQQIGLDAFTQLMKARHGKSAEESGSIKAKLLELGLAEEAQVLGRGFLKLTPKGRGVAQVEGRNRPKNLINSVFGK